ncbi:ATPase phospholipid transporting 8B2, partial [Chelydra serpentina]
MATSAQPFFLGRDLATAICRLNETDGRTRTTLVGRGQHGGAALSACLYVALGGGMVKAIDRCCIDLSFQIGLDTAYWTAVNQFFIWGSLSVYFAIIFTMYSDGMYLIFTASFPFIGTARNTLSQPNVWLAIFLSIILCVLPVVGGRFLKAQLMPTVSDK